MPTETVRWELKTLWGGGQRRQLFQIIKTGFGCLQSKNTVASQSQGTSWRAVTFLSCCVTSPASTEQHFPRCQMSVQCIGFLLPLFCFNVVLSHDAKWEEAADD